MILKENCGKKFFTNVPNTLWLLWNTVVKISVQKLQNRPFAISFFPAGHFVMNKHISISLLRFCFAHRANIWLWQWNFSRVFMVSMSVENKCMFSFLYFLLLSSLFWQLWETSVQSRAQTWNSCPTVKYLVTSLQQDYRGLPTARALRTDLCHRWCPSLGAVFIWGVYLWTIQSITIKWGGTLR